MRALIAVLVVTAALAAAPASSGLAAKLKGTVGPGYTIKLTNAAGKPVKTLKAGSYAITVSDRSAAHMFRLVGPGVNKAITSLGFRGTKTALVKVKAGKYIYQCDPHTRAGMKASFTVTR
jgi:plastocyanin